MHLEFQKQTYQKGLIIKKAMLRLEVKLTLADDEFDIIDQQKLWGYVILPKKEYSVKRDTTIKALAEGKGFYSDDLSWITGIQAALESRVEQFRQYAFSESSSSY